MKPLFIKKNGTVSKVSGIIMNLIPSYTMAEYNALIHKPLFWVRTDEEYAQIPATDVSYGSGSVKDALDGLGEKVKYKDVASKFILHSTATAVQKSFHLYGNVLFYALWVTFSETPSAAIDVFYTTEYAFLQQSIGLCMITDGFGAPTDFLGYSIGNNKISVNVGNISKIVTGKYYVFTGAVLVR